MKIKTITPETSYVNGQWTTGIGKKGIDILRKNFTESQRKRHRLCFHQNPDVLLHDIIISYDKSSYIPPNKHIGKSETILILEGKIQVFIFNDIGKCIRALTLGDKNSGLPFMLRMPPNTWHGLRCISETPCIMKETISGPYSKESLMWADFAPSEEENYKNNNGFKFYDELSINFTDELNLKPKTEYIYLSQNVIQLSNQFSLISYEDLKMLKAIAEKSPLKRSRLCLHPNSNDSLQEMLIYLSPECDIPVSYHLNKDESLLVIDGFGVYDFYADESKPLNSIDLISYPKCRKTSKESYFFTRINRFIGHKIIPGNDGILIYEATTGPFKKEDTQYMLEKEID